MIVNDQRLKYISAIFQSFSISQPQSNISCTAIKSFEYNSNCYKLVTTPTNDPTSTCISYGYKVATVTSVELAENFEKFYRLSN